MNFKKLQDVCEIKPPKKESKQKLSDDDLVSFVPMNSLNIFSKHLNLEQEKPLKDVYKGYVYFAENDVLLAKITPCFENGKLGIARNLKNGVGFGSSEYIVFRSKGQIDPDYLFYFLSQNSFRDEGSRVMSGAVGHKRVPKDFIEDYLIPVPPIAEQRRIVEILDEAFEGIDRAEANTKKNLANTQELFEQFLNKNFTQIKDGWEVKRISDISTNVEYGSSSKSLKNPTPNSIPVLRMGNMQGGLIDWEDLVYTDKEDEIEKYLLKYNDILFNRTNSDVHVGKTAIYKGERPAIFAGYLIRINYKENIVDPDFINFYLNSSVARDYGKSVMSRSINQANINGTKLKTYPIYLPSLEIQKEVVSKLHELQNQTKALEKIYQRKLEALAELKQSILQKAFTGQLT